MMRFTEEHEWVRIEGATARIGITDHAQHALGDITYVELPKVGRTVRRGEALAVVESVKAASDVYAPLGGRVAAVNARLAESPETVNAAAEGDGWLCTLEGFDPTEAEALMSAEQYAAFCRA